MLKLEAECYLKSFKLISRKGETAKEASRLLKMRLKDC